MKALPPRLLAKYSSLLTQYVSVNHHDSYRKGLRFYWDFCFKYQHKPNAFSSVPLFLAKLKSKNQPVEFCRLARLAVELYFKEIVSGLESSSVVGALLPLAVEQSDDSVEGLPNGVAEPRHQAVSHLVVNEPSPSYAVKGYSWVDTFGALADEIKIRHYSPKTLKSYQSWVRKFQTFVRSKDVKLVDSSGSGSIENKLKLE